MSMVFVRLLRLVASKEDAFTECLAAVLTEDPDFARDFLHRLCGATVGDIDVSHATIAVETQVSYPGSCVDMVISLNGRRAIGLEHKLWSNEGDEQLPRYCRLGFDRLAFVTAAPRRVKESVLATPVYQRPADGRDHFTWRDFYPAVEAAAARAGASPFAEALRELFVYFGFEPPKPEIGDLLDPDPELRARNRQNFAKLWDLTRKGLRERGWRRVSPGSIAELYVSEGNAKNVEWAWVDPTWARKLRVRVTPRPNIVPETLVNSVKEGLANFGQAVEVSIGNPARRKERREIAEVSISTSTLLEDCHTEHQISETLASFVLAVFDAAG